jgi:hypothetical protein
MNSDDLKYKFVEVTEEQIKVGEFLKAFDPILEPFEGMAKHGISLAIFFIGVTATFITVFRSSTPLGSVSKILLLSSWVLFLAAVASGSIQLWRIMSFREEMRRFAYVLLGDKPSESDREKTLSISQQSYRSTITIEYTCLSLGTVLFIVWAICQLNCT